MRSCLILDCNMTKFYATSGSIHVKLKFLKSACTDLLQERRLLLQCYFMSKHFSNMLFVGRGLITNNKYQLAVFIWGAVC